MARRTKVWLGLRFGKLVVIADDEPPTSKHRKMLCRCDCGKEKRINSGTLREGGTISCECSIASRPRTYGLRKRRHIVGKRYDRLVVLADDDPTPTVARRVLVRCDCGREKRVHAGSLLKGTTTSCGCAKGSHAITHGMTKSPTYSSWRSAINRCRNPRATGYEKYGAQGICFSDRWNRFEDFLEDMGIRPGEGYTLDRIDPEGHYQPGNCQWADKSTQRRNQTRESKVGFSKFKGVHRVGNRYHAMISIKNRTVRLGEFIDERKAARAYDIAAKKHHGKRAVTNAMLGRL